MDNVFIVDVRASTYDLLKYFSCLNFFNATFLFDILVKLATSTEFHDHNHIFVLYKRLQQLDDISVFKLWECVCLSVDFVNLVSLSHVVWHIHVLDSYYFSSGFMSCLKHFPKSAFSNFFSHHVVIQKRWVIEWFSWRLNSYLLVRRRRRHCLSRTRGLIRGFELL